MTSEHASAILLNHGLVVPVTAPRGAHNINEGEPCIDDDRGHRHWHPYTLTKSTNSTE